ncbi:MAG: glycosyltransferase family 39 protein [Lachnospiraceae bacterium]|nr:glycosyltransferase family 39 protein [Lachnospiraceae bacterium]
MNLKIKKIPKNYLILSAILLLGSLVRLLYLGAVPGGLHQDEAIVGWNAFSLLNNGYDSAGHVWPVYVADWGDGHSLMYCILTIPFLILNGNHLSHFATRMPQALVGILTILVLYGIIKKMYNETYALWGAFLLAICPWHITMCRWGLDANLVPGFLMFGLFFFIKGMENQKYLLLSALFYGLTLHCYAVIWPLVPLLMVLQILYGLKHGKLRINKWSIGASFILFVVALPCILFVLVNGGILEEIYLPFMSIPAMSGYRAGELAITPAGMWHNFKRLGSLLLRHDTAAIYDIIMPSGLFYNLGFLFVVLGVVCLIVGLVRKFRKKEFTYEFLLFSQLLGALVISLLVEVDMHQSNCLFIPLVICETIGVMKFVEFIRRRFTAPKVAYGTQIGLVCVFLLYFGQFEYLYFTEYKDLISLWFAEGISESVPHAFEAAKERAKETGESQTIVTHRGAQWPRLLYYTDTLGEEYLENVVYKENGIEPYSFTSDGVTFVNGFEEDEISTDNIYVFYYNTLHLFEEDFEVTQYIDWYVGIPKE